jgi:hypothetical protein
VLKVLVVAAAFGTVLGGEAGSVLANRVAHPAHTRKARVSIVLAKPGPANRLRVPSVAIGAGDRVQRSFDLKNTGKVTLRAVTLTTKAPRSSRLDKDRAHGLQLRITRCPKRWRQIGKTRRYACRARVVTVVALRPVIGRNIRLRSMAGLRRKRTAHLLLTLQLPRAAPNALQHQRSSLTYTFTAA